MSGALAKPAKSVTERRSEININSPQAVAQFAKELKKFIVEQKLYQNIQGKNYVLVEGWQFAGAALGLAAIPDNVTDLSNDKEVKYRAEARVLDKNDRLVGFGVAVCSNKEPKRKSADEYVIASMAQTRAIGKAYRNKLAWLMKLAGYEATPAEEASPVTYEPAEPEIVETPVETMRSQVTAKLATLATLERMRMLKTVGKLNQNDLTDSQYRQLWYGLELNAEEGK
jgi:hypothetical protein